MNIFVSNCVEEERQINESSFFFLMSKMGKLWSFYYCFTFINISKRNPDANALDICRKIILLQQFAREVTWPAPIGQATDKIVAIGQPDFLA
jgi:hypothetical protein